MHKIMTLVVDMIYTIILVVVTHACFDYISQYN